MKTKQQLPEKTDPREKINERIKLGLDDIACLGVCQAEKIVRDTIYSVCIERQWKDKGWKKSNYEQRYSLQFKQLLLTEPIYCTDNTRNGQPIRVLLDWENSKPNERATYLVESAGLVTAIEVTRGQAPR